MIFRSAITIEDGHGSQPEGAAAPLSARRSEGEPRKVAAGETIGGSTLHDSFAFLLRLFSNLGVFYEQCRLYAFPVASSSLSQALWSSESVWRHGVAWAGLACLRPGFLS